MTITRLTRRFPRRDPFQLFQIQSDFAAGLDPTDIAAKHELPVPAVMQIIRSRRRDDGLLDPFQLTQDSARLGSTNQIYWLGYIAACGRLYQQGPSPTLVLNVDPRDVTHIHTLTEDLCAGRPTCEFCQSSQNGLQAYIRDRELGQLLAQWGVPGTDPTEGSVPISFIPGSLLSHFVRGYLEGGHLAPPLGQKVSPASLASVRTVALAGPQEFVTTMSAALRRHLGIGAGTTTRRRDGLHTLTYRGRTARRIVQFAYKNATRWLPRATKLLHAMHSRPDQRNGSHIPRPRQAG